MRRRPRRRLKYEGKKVALIRLDVPFTKPFDDFYAKALAQLGGEKGQTVIIPATGQPDLAAAAARLVNSGPDVVNTNANEVSDTEILKSMAGLGYQGKMVVAGDLFRYATLQQLGALADRVVFVSPYPPVSAAAKFPGLTQFETDIKAEIASGDKDAAAADFTVYNRSYALGAYVSVIAAAKIANAAKASDASALKKAMNTATNVDLGGIIPPWTPDKSISTKIPRASNGTFYLSEWKNGAVTLLTPQPVDVTSTVDASMGG